MTGNVIKIVGPSVTKIHGVQIISDPVISETKAKEF